MLVYKKTFENVKTLHCDFPVEDQFYADQNRAIVADGITRDPIGSLDFRDYTKKDFLEKYPRPSGAELAAKEIVCAFSKARGSLRERLIACNEKVKLLNQKYISQCDYLQNDWYGAVASCVEIQDHQLDYAYICDCGVIVYDCNGNIKFQTLDDKALYSDPVVHHLGIPWYLPETRRIVREEYRNNIGQVKDGICVSYGALTGEEEAFPFIREGHVPLEKGDICIVYSDGFSEYLHRLEFIQKILNFQQNDFEEYIEMMAHQDYELYGKEKTLVLYRMD